MLQVENLTPECLDIINSYLSENTNKFLSSKKKLELMASLYARMDGAKPEVLSILHDSIKDLNETLSKDEIEILCSEYPAVMKYCFEKRDPFDGFMYSVDNNGYTNKMIPKSLLELCIELASPNIGGEVFLPYAGFSQITFSMPEANFDGFEINENRWASSQMVLNACGIKSSIIKTNEMVDSIPEGKQYDFIFCMPPFANGDAKKNVANNIYDLATKYLADKGCVCCILPKVFCFAKSGWFELRKVLRDYHNQYSAIIITLPRLYKLFNSTSLCVFCLFKDGNGDILLMDASKNDAFMVMHDPVYYENWDINVDSIIAILKHGSRDFCWYGEVKNLKNDVDLTPSHYIHPETNSYEGKEKCDIGDLIDIVPTEEVISDETTCSFIGLKELSDNYLNCGIQYPTIPKKKVKNAQILRENCLLVGVSGDSIGVGKTKGLSSEQFVALNPKIIPFRLKSKKVSEDYLLRNFMLNEDLIEEIRMLPIWSFNHLGKQEFLEMQIVVPSIEEQNQLVIADSKSSISEAEQKLKEMHDTYRKEVHMQKHAIGQTIFTINNWWETLQEVRDENSGVLNNDFEIEISRSRKIKVSSIFNYLQSAIRQLQHQISKFDSAHGMIEEQFVLTDFIKDYVAREEKQSPLFEFKYNYDLYHALEEKEGKMYVTFSREALEMVFDDIVSNACCHGFRDRESKENIIKIDLSKKDDCYVIIISNNGVFLNKQFNPSEVFTYGKTTRMGKMGVNGEIHSGIGGFEIKKLMEMFDSGKAEFINNPNSKFPISYKLSFYKTNK